MSIEKNETGLYEAHIDGRVYEFQKWGAEKSLDTLLDIMQFVGKPISLLANAIIGEGGAKADLKAEMLSVIMDSLLSGMSSHKSVIMSIIKRVACERVTCDRRSIAFDSHFQDDLQHLFKVVQAGLEVQYGNFFHAVLQAGGIKRKQAQALAS